jgi:hypothetical protein
LSTSADNGSTWDAGTGYSIAGLAVTSTPATDATGFSSGAASAIILASFNATAGLSNGATDLGWSGKIYARNLGSSSAYKSFTYHYTYSNDGTATFSVNGSGQRRNTAVVNGLRLTMSSGNIASGRIIIKGYY